MNKGKFFKKAILAVFVICAASPLAFSASEVGSDRIKWVEFKEIFKRINKTTDKAEKVIEGYIKYLNAEHQLVYENDEYVDRFIIDDMTYATVNCDVKMTDESVLVVTNSSAIYGYDWFGDYDNNLLEIQDQAIVHNFGGLGGVKLVDNDKGYFEKIVVDPSENVKYKKINITSQNGVGNGLFNYNAVNVNSIEMKGSETTLSGLSGGGINTSDIKTITYDSIAGSIENGAFLVNMNDDLVDKIGEWYVGGNLMDPVLNGYIMGTVNLNGGAVLMNVANVYIADPSKSTSGLDKPYIEKVVAGSGVNLIYNSGEIGEVYLENGVILNDSAEISNATDSTKHLVSGHIGYVKLGSSSAVLVNNENAVIDEVVGNIIHNKGTIKKWDYLNYDDAKISGYGIGRLEVESEITNRTYIEDSIINVKNGGVLHNDRKILNNAIVIDAGGAFYDAFEINDANNNTTGHIIERGSITNSGIFHTKNFIDVDSVENLEGGTFTVTQENLVLNVNAEKISNSGTMLFQNSSKISGGLLLYIGTFENKGGTATFENGFKSEIDRLNVSGGELINEGQIYIGKNLSVGTGGVLNVNNTVSYYNSNESSMENWTSSGVININDGGYMKTTNLENSGIINIYSGPNYGGKYVPYGLEGDVRNLESGKIIIHDGAGINSLSIENYGRIEIENGATLGGKISNYGEVENNSILVSSRHYNYGVYINNGEFLTGNGAGYGYNLENGTFINNGAATVSGYSDFIKDENGSYKIIDSNVNYGRWEQGENAVINVYETDKLTNKGTFVNKSLAGDDSAFKFDVLYNDGIFENVGSYKKQFVNNKNGTLVNKGDFAPTVFTNYGTVENESVIVISGNNMANSGLIKNSGTIELLASEIKLGSVEMGGANASVVLSDGKTTTLANTLITGGGSLRVGDSAVLNLGSDVKIGRDVVLNFSKSSVLNVGIDAQVLASKNSSLLGDINISANGELRVFAGSLGNGGDILNGGSLHILGGTLDRRIVSSGKNSAIYLAGDIISNVDISANILYFGMAEDGGISTLSFGDGAGLNVDSMEFDMDNIVASVGDELIFMNGLSEKISLSDVNFGAFAEKYAEGKDYFIINDASRFGIHFNSAIPEPSTYAAILGALALAIAACRRRK